MSDPVPTGPSSRDTLARAAYAAYGQSTGGLNFRGEPMPGWEDLGLPIQAAWIAAVDAVRHALTARPAGRGAPAPSEGRIVHVPMDPATNNGATFAPAVISRVFTDTCINVRVLGDGPDVEWRTSLVQVDSLAGATSSHVWAWPERI